MDERMEGREWEKRGTREKRNEWMDVWMDRRRRTEATLRKEGQKGWMKGWKEEGGRRGKEGQKE